MDQPGVRADASAIISLEAVDPAELDLIDLGSRDVQIGRPIEEAREARLRCRSPFSAPDSGKLDPVKSVARDVQLQNVVQINGRTSHLMSRESGVGVSVLAKVPHCRLGVANVGKAKVRCLGAGVSGMVRCRFDFGVSSRLFETALAASLGIARKRAAAEVLRDNPGCPSCNFGGEIDNVFDLFLLVTKAEPRSAQSQIPARLLS